LQNLAPRRLCCRLPTSPPSSTRSSSWSSRRGWAKWVSDLGWIFFAQARLDSRCAVGSCAGQAFSCCEHARVDCRLFCSVPSTQPSCAATCPPLAGACTWCLQLAPRRPQQPTQSRRALARERIWQLRASACRDSV